MMGVDVGLVVVVDIRDNDLCSSRGRYWVCWTSVVQVCIDLLQRGMVACTQGCTTHSRSRCVVGGQSEGNASRGLRGGLEGQTKVLGG